MSILPIWAQSEEARRLLLSILADPPATRIHRDDWGARTIYRAWQRPDVAALKRLFSAWWDANHETATELPEQPDELIGRLLGEAKVVPYVRMRINERPDGSAQVAA